MDKLALVEEKILNIPDGIHFEKMIYRLLCSMFPFEHIEHLGKMDGNDKPAHSKVDIWGDYLVEGDSVNLFVILTTEKDAFGKNKKVENDIKKAIDYILKTGPYSNPKIIFAINQTVDPKYTNYFSKICLEQNISFEFWGLGTISNHLIKHNQYLAETYLGIPMYSGCLIPLETFLDSLKTADEFSQTFMFREQEMQEIIIDLVNNQANSVILHGPQGSGKTRMALEICKQLTQNKDYDVYVIKNASSSIIDELKKHIDLNKKTILLIDDANKSTYINEIFDFCESHNNLHLLLTTRNYAFEALKQTIDNRIFIDKSIKALSNDQIEEIIRNSFTQIQNKSIIKYILDVSKGNLRFAIITAKVIVGENTKFQKISEVIKAFYKGLEYDLGFGLDEGFDNFVAALSFFETLNVNDASTLHLLSSTFGFEEKKVWQYIEKGYNQEIIDFESNDSTIHISDQIFATYLCYKKIYIQKSLSLKTIFDEFFEKYESRVVELVKNLIESYADDFEIIKKDLDAIFLDIQTNKSYLLSIRFLNIFMQLFPRETINYSYHCLKEHQFNDSNCSQLISMLVRQKDNFIYQKTIIDKFLDLFLECPSLKDKLLDAINGSFSVSRESIANDYSFEISLLNRVNAIPNVDIKLLVSLVNTFISYQVEECEQSRENNTMTFYRFSLVKTPHFSDFRKELWIMIDKILSADSFQLISNKYRGISFISNDNYELRKIDFSYLQIILDKRKAESLNEKMIELTLLEPFKKLHSAIPYLNQIYSNKTMLFYRDFISESTSLRLFGKEYNEAVTKFLSSNFLQIYDLITFIVGINAYFGEAYYWKVGEIVNSAFSIIKENNNDEFDQILIEFLSKASIIHFNLFSLFELSNDKEKLLSYFILQDNNASTITIIASLLFSLKYQDLTSDICEFAFSFFTSKSFATKNPIWGNETVSNLTEYTKFDSSFIHKVCLHYVKNENYNRHFLESLFIGFSSPEESLGFLEGDVHLLKEIYLDTLKNGELYDNDLSFGLYLASNDDLFFENLQDTLIKHKGHYLVVNNMFKDKRFVETFVRNLIKSISYSILSYSYVIVFERMPEQLFIEVINCYLSLYSKSESLLFPISSAIKIRGSKGRLLFLDLCLKNKVDIDILNKICIMDGPSSWSGNFSTYLKEDIENLKQYIDENENTLQIKYTHFLKEKVFSLEASLKQIQATETNFKKW